MDIGNHKSISEQYEGTSIFKVDLNGYKTLAISIFSSKRKSWWKVISMFWLAILTSVGIISSHWVRHWKIIPGIRLCYDYSLSYRKKLLGSILELSSLFSKHLEKTTIIIQNETGRPGDIDSILVSLIQLMLDKQYRTIDGLFRLIEKEWFAYGYILHTITMKHKRTTKRNYPN